MQQQLQYAPPTAALLTVDVVTATVYPKGSSPHYLIYYNTYRMTKCGIPYNIYNIYTMPYL